VPLLKRLFEDYLELSMEFIRKQCREIVESMNNNLAQSLMRILSCFID
jgi:dynein heavy chain